MRNPNESDESHRNHGSDASILRDKVQVAMDSLDRGEGAPLDVEALVKRVRARLATYGIVDQPPTNTS
jgi:hypothetical protein